MKNKRHAVRNSDHFDIYQIVLQGHLSSQWSSWFNGFTITLDQGGRTIMVGPVIDQAALHGVLKKIRDLGYCDISQPTRSCKEDKSTDLMSRLCRHY
jgi:hypothetical protein